MEDVCNGYILNTDTKEILALVKTIRPDLEFKGLERLLDEANTHNLLNEYPLLKCPHCKSNDQYNVNQEVQGTDGVISVSCSDCTKDFEVDYYPVIEFKAR
jgi:predicted Zn finger-like uncharacterized protein